MDQKERDAYELEIRQWREIVKGYELMVREYQELIELLKKTQA